MNLLADVQQTSNINWRFIETAMRAHRTPRSSAVDVPKLFQQSHSFDFFERQMQEAADQHQADISALRKSFIFQTDAAVASFLYDHRSIPQLLLEAVPHLHRCFGADKIPSLRIDSDEAGSRILYAVVPWECSVREARVALNSFDDQWWMAHAFQASGRLTFTYELI